MSNERTIEYIMKTNKPFYADSCTWNFYEGGQNTESVKHTTHLAITKLPDDKILAITVGFVVGTEQIILRLSPYEFDQLNALFKRASFRLEKA